MTIWHEQIATMRQRIAHAQAQIERIEHELDDDLPDDPKLLEYLIARYRYTIDAAQKVIDDCNAQELT